MPGVTSLQPLAAGGNSTVYRAWQPELDRWVAVKVLGVTLSEARARERFLRECSAVGRLTGHPNIVTVLASGVTRSERPFLTMDLFERGSLADLVATSGPVSVELALRYGVKLAGALETAHRTGILHRDLKPENVLLSRFGEPGLADFGIATLGEARGGTEAFTPTHAAPEVLEGREATAAADIYGLGSTLWTALAGRLPFGEGEEGPLRLMLRVLQEPLPPLGRDDVPADVEEVLRWALAKEPADRPASAHALGVRLRSLQAQLGLPVSELVVPDDLDHLGSPAEVDPARPTPARRLPGGSHPAPPGPPAARPAAATVRPRPQVERGELPTLDTGALVASGVVLPTPDPPSPDWSSDPSGPEPEPAAAHRQVLVPVGSELGGTVVRPRPGSPGPATTEVAERRNPARLALAIVAGAAVLAAALVAAAAVATRGRGQSPAVPPNVTVISTAPPAASTTTLAPAQARTPTAVAVRTVDPLTVVVTWKPPPDRTGLVGYVVAHRPRLGEAQLATQSAPAGTVEATVTLPTPGPRCFVIQSVYGPGAGFVSDAACT